jgi:hypothetical protein
MIRIDARTVELTDDEMHVSGWFDRLLDKGFSIPEAVTTLKAMTASRPPLDNEFWEYLGS